MEFIMLNKCDILNHLNLLNRDVILMHGSSLVMRGLKSETNDIDCMAIDCINDLPLSSEVGFDGSTILTYDVFDFGDGEIKSVPFEIVDGVKCQTLESIIEDKSKLGREKDLATIKLIQKYL